MLIAARDSNDLKELAMILQSKLAQIKDTSRREYKANRPSNTHRIPLHHV